MLHRAVSALLEKKLEGEIKIFLSYLQGGEFFRSSFSNNSFLNP